MYMLLLAKDFLTDNSDIEFLEFLLKLFFTFLTKYIYVVIFVVAVIFFLWLYLQSRLRKPVNLKKEQGKMASQEELSKFIYRQASGMFYLGEHYPLRKREKSLGDLGIPLDKRPQHIFIEAPTGTGKTTCFVIRQLIDDAICKKVNAITFDRKGREQFIKTGYVYKKCGHKIYYLSPWNPQRSMGFEPLYWANQLELRALVEGHVVISADPGDPINHYRVLEQEVLEALLKALKMEARCQGPAKAFRDKNGKSLCKYSSEQEALVKEAEYRRIMLEKYRSDIKPHIKACRCRRRIATLPFASNLIQLGYRPLRALIMRYPEIASECPSLRPEIPSARTIEMLAGLAGKMKYYLDEGPKQVFSRSDFLLDEITAPQHISQPKSHILYIDAPQEQGRASAVLSSVMSRLIYQKVNERRMTIHSKGINPNEIKHLAIWFDEIGTYTIPDINDMLATMRDTNTGAILLLQDINQLNFYYEQGVPEIIHSNSYCHVYTGKINQQRALKIANSIGKEITNIESYQVASNKDSRKTISMTESYILAPNEIEYFCRADTVPLHKQNDLKTQKKYNLDGLAIVCTDIPPFVIKKWAYFRTAKNRYVWDAVEESIAYNRKIEFQLAQNPVSTNDIQITWELVPSVYATLTKELANADTMMPMTGKQLQRIYARCKQLPIKIGYAKFLDMLATTEPSIAKPFASLTKRDAEIIIAILDKLILKAKMDKLDNSDEDNKDEKVNSRYKSKKKESFIKDVNIKDNSVGSSSVVEKDYIDKVLMGEDQLLNFNFSSLPNVTNTVVLNTQAENYNSGLFQDKKGKSRYKEKVDSSQDGFQSQSVAGNEKAVTQFTKDISSIDVENEAETEFIGYTTNSSELQNIEDFENDTFGNDIFENNESDNDDENFYGSDIHGDGKQRRVNRSRQAKGQITVCKHGLVKDEEEKEGKKKEEENGKNFTQVVRESEQIIDDPLIINEQHIENVEQAIQTVEQYNGINFGEDTGLDLDLLERSFYDEVYKKSRLLDDLDNSRDSEVNFHEERDYSTDFGGEEKRWNDLTDLLSYQESGKKAIQDIDGLKNIEGFEMQDTDRYRFSDWEELDVNELNLSSTHRKGSASTK